LQERASENDEGFLLASVTFSYKLFDFKELGFDLISSLRFIRFALERESAKKSSP